MISLETAAIRLGIALVFGALIGVEREWRHKTAGLKTNTLVALGATTFAMVSNTFGITNHNPAQIAAAVVTGIGFIGAGVIIHRGATIQGVTTAATLWANASVGVAIGLGQFYIGTALFAAVIFTQFAMRPIGRWIILLKHDENALIELHVECDQGSLAALNHAWTAYVKSEKLIALHRTTTDHSWRATFIAPGKKALDLADLEEKFVAISGVHKIESRFLGYSELPGAPM